MNVGLDDPLSYETITPDSELGQFVERRFKVSHTNWAVGTHFDLAIIPLQEWYVKFAAKLRGFYLIRSDFDIEIHVKGTKFHAGMLMASLLRFGQENAPSTAGRQHLTVWSQRPRVMIEAGTSQTAVIRMPFVYPYSWYNNVTLSQPDAGVVNINSLTTLSGINTTDDVEICIYIRAINPVIAGPTQATDGDVSAEEFYAAAGTKMTVKDEYAVSPISSTASAIAAAAGALTKVPYIGIFARATEIGAGAVGGIARLFGFSHPVQIGDPAVMRPTPVSNLALTEGADTVQKLTVTAKQEITVDPRTVGLLAEDELSLKYLGGIESLIGQFTWAVTDAPGTDINRITITPSMNIVIGSGDEYYQTALGFMSKHFWHWSGTIKYRFVVVATSFHQGKLLAWYEPTGYTGGMDPDEATNYNYNHIVDIGVSRDFEIEVPWSQFNPYAETTSPSVNFFGMSAAFIGPDLANGMLHIAPFTRLTTPDSVTSVQILVFASAGHDFELANPCSWGEYVNEAPTAPWTAADGEVDEDVFYACSGEPRVAEDQPGEHDFGGSPTCSERVGGVNSEARSMLYFGEKITSLRQLMKRYYYYRTYDVDYVDTVIPQFAYPCPRTDSAIIGMDASTATLSGAYTWTGITPFWTIGRAFGMWRGAIRYKFVPISDGIEGMYGARFPTLGPYGNEGTAQNLGTTATDYRSYIRAFDNQQFAGTNGSFLTHEPNINLEVEIPYYKSQRASSVRTDFRGWHTTRHDISGDALMLTLRADGAGLHRMVNSYVSAGDDFTFLCFNGAGYYSIKAPPSS